MGNKVSSQIKKYEDRIKFYIKDFGDVYNKGKVQEKKYDLLKIVDSRVDIKIFLNNLP